MVKGEHEIDTLLLHYGVKGMRWGIIRNSNKPGGADGVDNSKSSNKDTRGPIKIRLDSMKRERSWHKVVKEVDKLSTKDVNKIANRIGLENDLKKYSREIGNDRDRRDYLRRDRMSDQELNRKVNRLRAKDNLYKKVKGATESQVEFGTRAVKIASALGMKYAVKRSIEPKDIFEAYSSSKSSKKSKKKK